MRIIVCVHCSLLLFSISSYVLKADKELHRFSPVTWKVGLSLWLWQEKRSNEETLWRGTLNVRVRMRRAACEALQMLSVHFIMPPSGEIHESERIAAQKRLSVKTPHLNWSIGKCISHSKLTLIHPKNLSLFTWMIFFRQTQKEMLGRMSELLFSIGHYKTEWWPGDFKLQKASLKRSYDSKLSFDFRRCGI